MTGLGEAARTQGVAGATGAIVRAISWPAAVDHGRLYAERDLCQAIVSYGRDYLVRIKGNQPEALAALSDGFVAGEEAGEPQAETLEKSGGDREAAYLDRCRTGQLYPG